MILADRSLKEWARRNLDPYDESLINPASIDLRFGNMIRTDSAEGFSDPFEIDRYTMLPGDFILAHTLESIIMPIDCVGILLLKSTAGRWGFEHSHSSYVDPRFRGQLTLELSNVSKHCVEIIPGKPIVQLVLMRCEIPEIPYGEKGVGHYQHQMGPTKPWK